MIPPPCARPDLIFEDPLGDHRVVCQPVNRAYFRMGLAEAAFLQSLDGRRTLAELSAPGEHGFTEDYVQALVEWLGNEDLLEGVEARANTRGAARTRAFWERLLHPERLRAHLLDPDAWLDRHRPFLGAFFSRAGLGLYLLIFLSPAAIYLAAPRMVAASARAFHLPTTAAEIVQIGALLVAMNVIHELSHALACKHFGGRVHRIGLMLMYLCPVLYCDVSDSWRFRKASHKVVVASAGIFSQMVLSALAVSGWMLSGAAPLASFAVLCAGIGLLNFFPFIMLDGYWVLAHALNEPDLRQKSVQAVDQTVRRWLGHGAGSARPRLALVAFGVGCLLVTPGFWALTLSSLYWVLTGISAKLAALIVAVVTLVLLIRLSGEWDRYRRSFRSQGAVDTP